MWVNDWLLILLAVAVRCQVILLDDSHTDVSVLNAYKKHVSELHFTNTIFTKDVLIDWRRYTCYIPIAYEVLHHQRTLNESAPGEKELLLPLNHLCAVYSTKQFLYEVCPGKHVRQFDDATTIQNMGKEKPENIIMGKQVATAEQRKVSKTIVSTVSRKHRYVMVVGRIGRTNYNLPYSKNRYGTDVVDLNCTNGKHLIDSIILTSKTEFVLVSDHVGECFAKVTSKSIRIGGQRVSLPSGSLVVTGNIIVGECPATGPYAFIEQNGEIIPRRIDERINDQTLVLKEKIDTTSNKISCQLITLTSNCTLELVKGKVQVVGYVLTSELPLDLNPNDLLLVSYTLANGIGSVQQISVDFALTSQKILLKDLLRALFKIKSISVYVIRQPVETDEDQSIGVAQPTESQQISRKIRLGKGEELRVNSTDVYITFSGKSVMAILLGDDWDFVVKDRPLKVRRYPNGSIEVVEENAFYENLTFTGDTFHVTEECIWAESDFYEFCRVQTGMFHTIRAISELDVTIYNLSARIHFFNTAQNAHLRHKKLNRGKTPLKVVENYPQGEQCGEPINKARNTTVEYVCGNSWFSIKNITETSPCQYYLEVQTRLLCEDSFEQTIKHESSKDTVCFSSAAAATS